MGLKHQPINDRLTVNTNTPGYLTLVIPSREGLDRRQATLTPKEVDQLVLSALSMTKPEDLDPNAEEVYEDAMEAIRVWLDTRDTRESVRRRDAERDAVLKEAGYVRLTYAEVDSPFRYLVDQLIEARKAGQQ